MKKFLFTIVILFIAAIAVYAQSNQPAPAPAPAAKSVTVEEDQSFKIRAAPGLVISGVSTICKGGETTLKVEGEYESFLWNTGSTDRFLHIKEAGVYEVTVRTKGGCSITGSVNVEVVSCL